MKCPEELIRNFVDNLKREGMQAPTEIFFPKKTYDMLVLGVYRSATAGELTLYVQDAKVVIRKQICKECGQ